MKILKVGHQTPLTPPSPRKVFDLLPTLVHAELILLATMASEILSEGVKQIIGTMRELIENKIAIKEEKVEGDVWKYSGEEFLSEVSKLENEMRKQGANVEQCNAYHCVRGANIQNLTGRLFLIPVNGTPTLTKGGPLLPGSRYFFEGQPSKEKKVQGIPLFGDGIDIVIVVLK